MKPVVVVLMVLVLVVVTGCGGAVDAGLAEVRLYSLAACNGCATARQSLESLKAEFPSLKFTETSITGNPTEAAFMGIDKHPTILFLNGSGQEIGRLERLKDKAEISAAIKSAMESPGLPVKRGPATPAAGRLTAFYLYAPADGTLRKVLQYVPPSASAYSDKIDTVNYYLGMRNNLPAGLSNPVPRSVVQKKSASEAGVTLVILSDDFASYVGTPEGNAAVKAIAYAMLGLDGVTKVQVRSAAWRSDVFDRLSGDVSPSKNYAPAILSPWVPVKASAAYNIALLHRAEMEYMPCDCGCGAIGHRSNWNCYFRELAPDSWAIDQHGENCEICVNITLTYDKVRAQGMSLADTRRTVDSSFPGRGKTATPMPPE